MMRNILLIGAGRSTSSLIHYLLENSVKENWIITVGDYSKDLAVASVGGNNNARAIFFNANDDLQRRKEIKASDIVISMLPARMHHLVVKDCICFKKHLITASYTSEEIQDLDSIAKQENILILNEIGLDPGIDHMSAMRVIDQIHTQNGKLTSFKSFCGGLIHPKYDNNAWNYKFTWNPRNVVLAGLDGAEYLKNNRRISLSYQDLFNSTEDLSIPDLGLFEAYPNRDSFGYIDTYGLKGIPTFLRGTVRKKGFCKAWDIFVQLGMTDDSIVIEDLEGMTYKDYLKLFLLGNNKISIEDQFCKKFNLSRTSDEFQKFCSLDLFSDINIGLKRATSAQVLQKILEDKWNLSNNDKDMVVMKHEFIYTLEDKRLRKWDSSLVVYGEDMRYTAMAKTVGLPMAIAVKLILNKKINLSGVHIPTIPEIYNPILDELECHGISFIEDTVDL